MVTAGPLRSSWGLLLQFGVQGFEHLEGCLASLASVPAATQTRGVCCQPRPSATEHGASRCRFPLDLSLFHLFGTRMSRVPHACRRVQAGAMTQSTLLDTELRYVAADSAP